MGKWQMGDHVWIILKEGISATTDWSLVIYSMELLGEEVKKVKVS